MASNYPTASISDAFTCGKCGNYFLRLPDLMRHRRTCHPDPLPEHHEDPLPEKNNPIEMHTFSHDDHNKLLYNGHPNTLPQTNGQDLMVSNGEPENTPICDACAEGNLDLLKATEVNRANSIGDPPMMAAYRSGNIKVGEFLKEKDATGHGSFVVRSAVLSGNAQMLRGILQNNKVPLIDSSALIFEVIKLEHASLDTRREMLELLHFWGVKPHVTPEVVSLLIQRMCDHDAAILLDLLLEYTGRQRFVWPRGCGYGPVLEAIRLGYGDVIRCLRHRGFKLNLLDRDIPTLHEALMCGIVKLDLDIVRDLLRHTALVCGDRPCGNVYFLGYIYFEFFTRQSHNQLFEQLYNIGPFFNLMVPTELQPGVRFPYFVFLVGNIFARAPENLSVTQLFTFFSHMCYLEQNSYISYDLRYTDNLLHPVIFISFCSAIARGNRLYLLHYFLHRLKCHENIVEWCVRCPLELEAVLNFGAPPLFLVSQNGADKLESDEDVNRAALCLANNSCSRRLLGDFERYTGRQCVGLQHHLSQPFRLQLMSKVAVRNQLRRSGKWTARHVMELVEQLPLPEHMRMPLAWSGTPLWE